MLSIEQITQGALSLPNTLRVFLVEKLIESLEFDVDEAIQASWTAAAKQRREEIRTGVVQSIPGDEALAQVRQILG
jgi:Putative addiction module component